MAHTIGQYLIGSHGERAGIEVPHPSLPRRKIDFAVYADEKNLLLDDVIETKLVSSGRDFRQEIYDDLVRLELACSAIHAGGAWLLIAGMGGDIKKWVVSDGSEEVSDSGDTKGKHADDLPIKGDGFVILPSSESKSNKPNQLNYPFKGILAPFSSDDPQAVDVKGAEGESREFWRKSFEKCDGNGPSSFTTHLQGRWLFDDAIDDERWNCMVWRISSSTPRETINTADLTSHQ
ncbi:hypothetical protein M4951_06140 [Blastopirellula sp. J2-11]|uniref:hypothetical protein n=1 Tax=Blastopirellula sp. J2-11 TaxID=2943192 RepID=UPI0021C62BDF|nr:hypothetical protein [Blastopirellula sp. J2-11]UUO07891.1 hypothetical protein M4951_06140 [Blastopirellula sp. J2-11]